jgi:hypothetical protein
VNRALRYDERPDVVVSAVIGILRSTEFLRRAKEVGPEFVNSRFRIERLGRDAIGLYRELGATSFVYSVRDGSGD